MHAQAACLRRSNTALQAPAARLRTHLAVADAAVDDDAAPAVPVRHLSNVVAQQRAAVREVRREDQWCEWWAAVALEWAMPPSSLQLCYAGLRGEGSRGVMHPVGEREQECTNPCAPQQRSAQPTHDSQPLTACSRRRQPPARGRCPAPPAPPAPEGWPSARQAGGQAGTTGRVGRLQAASRCCLACIHRTFAAPNQ